MSALNTVKKVFPKVIKVVDATKGVSISVLEQDAKAGRKKDAKDCALALACKRSKIAEGAIIGLSVSYLINGDTATRYRTSQAVGREITSFDRHHDFAEGSDYKLSPIPKQMKLNTPHRGGSSNGSKGPRTRKNHKTAFVRELKNL